MLADVCDFCRLIIQYHTCMAGVGFTRQATRPVTSASGVNSDRSLDCRETRSSLPDRNLRTQRFLQNQQMHGPPMYYTPDWDTAREIGASVGHARAGIRCHRTTVEPCKARRCAVRLHDFAPRVSIEIARPKHGRYAREPAHADASGTIVRIPPKK